MKIENRKNMKKKILLVVLAVVMLSFVGCDCKNNPQNPVFEGVVTGKLLWTGLPVNCPPNANCLVPAVWAIANNTGTFILLEDGQPIFTSAPLRLVLGDLEFSAGDEISIFGTYSRGTRHYNRDFYFLEISHVVE